MSDTFNITIKCDTEEKRDILLDIVCQYPELARCNPVSNVFFQRMMVNILVKKKER